MLYTKAYRLSFTRQAQVIVQTMTLEEKVHLMYGKTTLDDLIASPKYNYIPYGNGKNNHGVPEMLFVDGPRGAVCGDGKSTSFPVSMMRGASFDPDLETAIGQAIAREIRAYGGNLFGGVCINLPYHPGWGRSQEVYGEDPCLLGTMGAALVQGIQSEPVIACVKHFAFNSMENSRFDVSVECDRRTEQEVYLPHFKDCIDAGAAAIMSAYNRYQGNWCSQHNYLLRSVLKEAWDFDGFVMSDFLYALKDTVDAVYGGCDMEMCDDTFYGHGRLVQAVKEGYVDERLIDEAALRIVRTMLAFQSDDQTPVEATIIGCKAHQDLALKAAEAGLTLIKNDGVLPVDAMSLKSIAVLGPLADQENTGDHGSSWVLPAYVVTPVEGLSQGLPHCEIIQYDGADIEHAKALAKEVDLVIFTVGFNFDDEGEFVSKEKDPSYTGAEGGDRKQGLGLHAKDVALIQAVGPLAKQSIAVLYGGNTITITEWMEDVNAIFMAYYSGQEGGTALAKAIIGAINPSGKLPFVLPYKESDLPGINWKTKSQYYDYYHGYTKLDKEGVKPLRPFGFGLSYTQFELDDYSVHVNKETIEVSVTVKNTGGMAGAEVVQVYIGYSQSKIDRPVKVLKGFKKVQLNVQQAKQVTITVSKDKIKWYNTQTKQFELETMVHEVYVGCSSGEADLRRFDVMIEQ